MKRVTITTRITKNKQKSTDLYFNEIRTIEVLKHEEEDLLLRKIRMGDRKALDRFIKCNLKFVVSISKTYQYYLNMGDLINEGNLGLIDAIKKFDETKGFKFITYAVWAIRQGIVRAINTQKTGVRVPQSQLSLSKKVRVAGQKLEQELGRYPTSLEILECLHMKEKDESKIRECRIFTGKHLSLDEIISDNENCTLLNIVKNDAPDTDNQLMLESLAININRILNILSDVDREILVRFFGIGGIGEANLYEIASQFGLSPERIRQRKDHALKRLRKRCKELNLMDRF